MNSSLLLRENVVLGICVFVSATMGAQSSVPPKQHLEAVNSHLTRHVILKNSANPYMQLAPQMESLRVPAVSMAAIQNGRIDWAQAYGVTSLGGERATTHTLFGAASLSKPVTAVGVLRLVENGKIDLDTDVNHYLKRWKIPESTFTNEKKVTVRELLSHTSGIGTHKWRTLRP